MRICIIVAAAENGIIGANGKMPWHIPEDLKRFKRLTMGHPIIMGRKTWESIGRALPGRLNIVITRQESYQATGARVVGSLHAALDAAHEAGASQAFVIGGGEIYREALPLCERIELTRVHGSFEGDASFPPLGPAWREVAREDHPEATPPYSFLTLERATKVDDHPSS